jgi:2-methylcitrate dehydratase PrpD
VSGSAAAAGPTETLAAFASGLRPDDLPAPTLENAKRSVLDTIGCALHGSTLPWGRSLQRVAEAEGGAPAATVWAGRRRTSPQQAALLNATAGHSFELDDIHMGGMIHPGSLTLASALAVGEQRGIDGKTCLAAIVAGCEVGARVGLAVGTAHFRAGFHPQGTVGVFAAAAAAARALGLDGAHTRQTLGIAGSQASGLMAAQEGAMVKRLHSGRAAQSGVLSALLAEQDFTGIPDVLEAEFGGFCGTMGGGSVDFPQLTAGLGDRWETEQIGFKAYASCAAAHTSLDVVRLLRAEHNLSGDDVRAVTVHTSTHTVVHCGWEYRPNGVTAAQMSIPYGVARMLFGGAVTADDFTEAAIADPRVLALVSRVNVLPDPEIDALGSFKRYTVRVEVETHDGRIVEGGASDRLGSPTYPLAPGQLEEKFFGLATPVVGKSAADRIADLVAGLHELDDVRSLAELLHSPTAG